MHYSFEPSSEVCSYAINLDIDEQGVIQKVVFSGGCAGNLLAISKLVKGQKARDIIALLKGNRCGAKSTSCADQMTIALEKALAEAGL